MIKKTLILCVCLMLLLSACGTKKEEIKKNILENMQKIDEVSDMTSSNPYDYINNEYYGNIVSLGKDAVPVLEEMYRTGELTGLHAYISAIAVQEITGADLEWSTAEEFYSSWEKTQ